MDPTSSTNIVLTADGVPACGAKKKDQSRSDYCMKRRGWGTVHVGWGRCKLHGGSSPAGITAALKEQMAAEMENARLAVMGTALDVDPMDALLWCVRITAGEVAYSTKKVQDLTPDQEIVRPEIEVSREGGALFAGASEEKTQGPEELNLWIKVRQASVERLAKFSKMALDAGVAERAVKLAEGAGESLAVAIRSILVGLDLSYEQEQKAPELVRTALEMLEGPNAAGQGLLNS